MKKELEEVKTYLQDFVDIRQELGAIKAHILNHKRKYILLFVFWALYKFLMEEV